MTSKYIMICIWSIIYIFSESRYLGCVGEHMKPLKPFGDVPDKLSVILKRSFVATRTYAQALNIASEITRYLQNVSIRFSHFLGDIYFVFQDY